MRIAFVSSVGGGLNTYVITNSRYLVQQGHEVHVFYIGNQLPPWPFQSPDLHLYTVPYGKMHYYVDRIRINRGLATWLRAYEVSASLSRAIRRMHALNPFDVVELIEGVIAPHLFQGLPYIVKMHSAEWIVRHYCEDGKIYQFQTKELRKILLQSRLILSPSNSLADFVAGACHIPRGMIKCVRNCINLGPFNNVVRSPSCGPPYHLIFVGRLEKRKGINVLVQALRRIWLNEPDIHMHFFGDSGDCGEKEIRSELIYMSQMNRLHFHGHVSQDELICHLVRAHLFVSPTRYDNAPYNILEAMAAGIPIIASDIGGVPELITHELTGWLVPRDDPNRLAEQVLFALNNPEIRSQYSAAAKTYVERFSVERLMPEKIMLYSQISSGSCTSHL